LPVANANNRLLGGRLCLDFINTTPTQSELTWEELILFLESARVVSAERCVQLLALPQSDPQAAQGLLRKAQRLSSSLHKVFMGLHRKQKIPVDWTEPINAVLRITEGHDELFYRQGAWQIEFVAREGGLDWLLAAVARSAAELVAEGAKARLRLCANSNCGLFFYDKSRTHRRRWCSMAVCGNRSKVAAFARKHSTLQRDN
jgi:predicted RNA-binding Zn ribbon-like protein